jgi:DNA-binding transcriptional LysR family regulator
LPRNGTSREPLHVGIGQPPLSQQSRALESGVAFFSALSSGRWTGTVRRDRRRVSPVRIRTVDRSKNAPQIISIASFVAAALGVFIVPVSLAALDIPGVSYIPIAGQVSAAPLAQATRPN